jgi:hypothetical protein
MLRGKAENEAINVRLEEWKKKRKEKNQSESIFTNAIEIL